MTERFVLLANPRAGAGAAARRLPALEGALRKLGAVFDTALTEGPGHARELTREALEGGARGVAVVGGDGTLNEALNGYLDETGAPVAPGAWLAPLPSGTGGDLRRTLGISKDVEAMARQMMAAAPRPIDAGWLTFVGDDGATRARAFANIASFGLGGRVDRAVNDGPKWIGGTPAFLLGTLRAMIGYRRPRVRLTLDDRPPREARILNVAVANGRFFGGGMKIAPDAQLDDGLFDVVGLELSVPRSFALTAAIYRGRHLRHPAAWLERARRIHAEPVDPGEAVLLDVDGEAPGRLPATFELRAGAITLRG